MILCDYIPIHNTDPSGIKGIGMVIGAIIVTFSIAAIIGLIRKANENI